MALVLADRVKETTTTAGTGTVTLLGASTGFQSFAVVGNGNTTYYTIAGQTTSEWEVGIGTYTASGTLLARTTVLSNSSGTQPSALSFSAGTKDVFVTYPAEKSINEDASGNVGVGTTAPAAKLNVIGTTIISNVNVLGASYDSVSFSVSGQELTPAGLFFSADGSKMFVIGTTGDDVNEYVLSTPWVVSSATYSTVFSVSAQELTPNGLFFRADGLKMYVVGLVNDTVFQYALTSPWSVATASYESISFSVAAEEINPTGIFFKPDGLSMYVTGTTSDGVYQYTLSTAWNVSTATFLQTFSVSGQENAPQDLSFTNDGTRLFITGSQGDDVNVYNLTTPWDISTATSVGAFSVAAQESVPAGLFIKPDGTKMYVVGTTNDTVYQYTVPSVEIQLTGTTAINGSATVAQDLTVNGDVTGPLNVTGTVTATTFAGAGTSLTGTASGLSIGGNATTATTATTANALNTANSYTAVTYTSTGGRSSFTAVSEPFAVGAKYSSGGGSVYFGASDGTATPGIQLSFATGAAALSISTAGVVSGTSFSGAGTGLTGTASGLTAGNVTTNANLTGDVTSVGNATSIAAGVIVDADINASAGIVDTKLATISTASKVSNSATTATNANTASAIVARDASGNFSAGTITATLTGTATGLAGTPNITVGTIAGGNTQISSLGINTAASGTAGEIRATNNITAYYSDDRFKTNLGNIPDALAKVLTLNGFYYEANELAQSFGYEKILEVGVSAQQVQAVQPEVVVPAPIDENYLTVRYERLVPLLIEAIKELNAKVTALEQVVAKSTQG